MTKNYDQDFGPGGKYPWPGDLKQAERVIRSACSLESSSYLLNKVNSHFFCLRYLNRWIEDKEVKLLQVAEAERRKLSKDAMDWTLPYFVTSAVYFTLSTKVELSVR